MKKFRRVIACIMMALVIAVFSGAGIVVPDTSNVAYAAQTKAIKLSKTKVTFTDSKKSVKVKCTTSYSKYGLTYKVISGGSNVTCSWAKKWSGKSIYLTVKSKSAGPAKIKVWVTGYPKKCRTITVNYDRGYDTCYEADNYKVGTNMKAGEYVVFANGGGYSGYVCISEDSNQDEIIENEIFDYNTIIQVRNGDYLEISRGYAVPISEAKVDINKAGAMYKVGYHIKAGEYTLSRSSSTSAYYAILNGPVGSDRNSMVDNIVDNDNFSGSRAYVTVEDGQYLEVTRCTGNFVEPENKIALDETPNYTTVIPASSKFKVNLPSLPYKYEFKSTLTKAMGSIDATVNEIEVKKMYDPNTGKYAAYCTAYGSMEITGTHMVVMKLKDIYGNEVESSSDVYSNSKSYTVSGSIELTMNVENLDEGEYTLEISIF